jgi:hypothetical protein
MTKVGKAFLQVQRDGIINLCANALIDEMHLEFISAGYIDHIQCFTGQPLNGCCPNPFSLVLKRFLINLRLASGDVKTLHLRRIKQRPLHNPPKKQFDRESFRFQEQKKSSKNALRR